MSWRNPGGAFDKCDMRPVLESSGPLVSTADGSWYWVSTLSGMYDENGDSAVTKAEFQAGLDKITCCGSKCPFESWCELVLHPCARPPPYSYSSGRTPPPPPTLLRQV